MRRGKAESGSDIVEIPDADFDLWYEGLSVPQRKRFNTLHDEATKPVPKKKRALPVRALIGIGYVLWGVVALTVLIIGTIAAGVLCITVIGIPLGCMTFVGACFPGAMWLRSFTKSHTNS